MDPKISYKYIYIYIYIYRDLNIYIYMCVYVYIYIRRSTQCGFIMTCGERCASPIVPPQRTSKLYLWSRLELGRIRPDHNGFRSKSGNTRRTTHMHTGRRGQTRTRQLGNTGKTTHMHTSRPLRTRTRQLGNTRKTPHIHTGRRDRTFTGTRTRTHSAFRTRTCTRTHIYPALCVVIDATCMDYKISAQIIRYGIEY